jgi:riboflavin biosynthesis pyrimidine reductase
MRQLFPVAKDPVDPAEVYADLPDAKGRPSVRLNMIVSIDGGTSWNGVSGALGGPADKSLFATMRSLTDLVLVASGTMQAEQYGPAVLPPAIQSARRERGQTPVPPIAVVTLSANFNWDSPFFTAATERPIVITGAAADAANVKRASEVADVIIAGEEEVDLRQALDELGKRGTRTVLAEGGPTLNGELVRVGLLDELCVTLSPLLASGDAKRIVAGSTLDELAPLCIRSICEEDDYLFCRYRAKQS